MPKALLQQHCLRQRWPPPCFDKLAPGGARLGTSGFRYAVTVDAGPSGRGRGRKRGGPRTYQLREEEDGWETINVRVPHMYLGAWPVENCR
jgi:hypothetical protein